MSPGAGNDAAQIFGVDRENSSFSKMDIRWIA